ncbi:MAG TPA: hypothetical protein VFK62_05865 [Gaiellaceae bacterium]|nr:hypothetical protein [Gaiellaceae bacterium]
MARITTAGLVRCLDCGTEYHLASERGEADPCPRCGGVGWIALEACDARRPKENSS